MQSAREFISEYLARKFELTLEAARQSSKTLGRFFAPNYRFFLNEADAESFREQCVELIETPTHTDVITSGHPRLGRSKYRVQPFGDSWQISSIAHDCFLCRKRGAANPECKYCDGSGWKDMPGHSTS